MQQYYQSAEMEGFSIPAAEHSTITAWGSENEVRAVTENAMVTKAAKMITQP